jgi:hypothetical protein
MLVSLLRGIARRERPLSTPENSRRITSAKRLRYNALPVAESGRGRKVADGRVMRMEGVERFAGSVRTTCCGSRS